MNKIRLLAEDRQRVGRLFEQLMADLMIALGYEQPQLNVYKSGRELDLSAAHRLEPRRAIAECKATVAPVGGASVNKFIGVLDLESRRAPSVTGYFISLSGFTGPAHQQEDERNRGRRARVVLLDGAQVIEELIQGRILISRERAVDIAARIPGLPGSCTLDRDCELLAHVRGWIWAVYYVRAQVRSHFALISSDGTLLSAALATEIVASDRDRGGSMHTLSRLNPVATEGSTPDSDFADALSAYHRYLSAECGYIQLDGLPADSELGSRRLRLESLFVPLHLDIDSSGQQHQSVGQVLAMEPRLAILGPPGGGKSTLIKRLAVAYVDTARRREIADDLPELGYLPVFFRCRELRGSARSSFGELLAEISQCEPVRQHASSFLKYIDRELNAGRVLLLVDGLDEIADAGDRAAFVCSMRAALQAYPGTAIMMTSREAGFRHVAAHLAPVCTSATLSPFDADDIRRLSACWHREVGGDSTRVYTEADLLATTIIENDRILRLARNPLLLTTLFLVKRWVGSLPTRRAVLYGKAVEVLLMTWNTEGHEPIPEEEASPQLCYVAYSMMKSRLQRISRPRLTALLREARSVLSTELGYVKWTVDDFIRRVEERSSLLMMTGHDIEDGRLVEFFEFRHLTFQEYLAARAVVEGWHTSRGNLDDMVSVLEPHLFDEGWQEVIPLAAALGGKGTEALVGRLTGMVLERTQGVERAATVLGRCLGDGAPASPEVSRAALDALMECGALQARAAFAPSLCRGKYAEVVRCEARRLFLSGAHVNAHYAGALQAAVEWQELHGLEEVDLGALVNRLVVSMASSDSMTRCEAALQCLSIVEDMDLRTKQREKVKSCKRIGAAVSRLLSGDGPRDQYLAGLVLGSLGSKNLWISSPSRDVVVRMAVLWQTSADPVVRVGMVDALVAQHLVTRSNSCGDDSFDTKILERFTKPFDTTVRIDRPSQGRRTTSRVNEDWATLIVAWHQKLVDDNALAGRVRELQARNWFSKSVNPWTLERIQRGLGVSDSCNSLI